MQNAEISHTAHSHSQLAHQSGDKYGEAYDRGEFKDERKEMMQKYADYIDAPTQTIRSESAV